MGRGRLWFRLFFIIICQLSWLLGNDSWNGFQIVLNSEEIFLYWLPSAENVHSVLLGGEGNHVFLNGVYRIGRNLNSARQFQHPRQWKPGYLSPFFNSIICTNNNKVSHYKKTAKSSSCQNMELSSLASRYFFFFTRFNFVSSLRS